jgi:hypothetical protein
VKSTGPRSHEGLPTIFVVNTHPGAASSASRVRSAPLVLDTAAGAP